MDDTRETGVYNETGENITESQEIKDKIVKFFEIGMNHLEDIKIKLNNINKEDLRGFSKDNENIQIVFVDKNGQTFEVKLGLVKYNLDFEEEDGRNK